MKVSVVCPSYNAEKYIGLTIQSILDQSEQDFEIIVVDDCSSDKTVEIVKSFNDKRIRLFVNNENKGAAYSRNFALRHAIGEYIAFLDADDLWTPEKLEHQLKFMEENKYAFSYTKYEEIDDDGNRVGKLISGPKRITHRGFLHMCYPGCLTVIYKREIFPDLQIPENLPKNNDYAMWLLLSKKADCYLLDENLGQYRRHQKGSISSGKKSNLFKYHIDLYKKIFGFGSLRAFLYSLRNVFFYFHKRVRYIKKIK